MKREEKERWGRATEVLEEAVELCEMAECEECPALGDVQDRVEFALKVLRETA